MLKNIWSLALCIGCMEVAMAWAPNTIPARTLAPPRAAMCGVAAKDLRMSIERSDAAPQQLQRRQLTSNAARLTAVGAAAFSLVRPVLAAGQKGKPKPVIVTDKNMEVVKASDWLEKHPKAGNRGLVVGLDGEPYWLITLEEPDGAALAGYALRAECTHLGCLADWRPGAGKYICPCHGSEYDKTGKVTKGPAPKSLLLAKVDILDNDVVQLSQWDEADFRA